MKGGASNSESRAGSCHSGEPEPEPHVEQDEGAALQWTTTGSRVVPSAARKPYRLLALEGEKGAVFCRVHDELSRSRLPHLSEHGTLEFATRSLLRMFNLTVFRISERRASMVGPGDYYGNVEAPHAHSHTVTLGGPDETPPVFVPHPIEQAAQPVKAAQPPPPILPKVEEKKKSNMNDPVPPLPPPMGGMAAKAGGA